MTKERKFPCVLYIMTKERKFPCVLYIMTKESFPVYYI